VKATLDSIRPIFEPPADAARNIPTAALLRDFLAHRDEVAFAELVRRHGAMVLGVCRRVTGNAHDADDAFQATFLVLAKKAHTVRPAEQLGAWLFGVACRTAQKARANAARHREGERRFAQMNPVPVSDDSHTRDSQWNDLRPVLDEELNRLPARYRAAIVACDLEGKSRRDAAIDLAINEGTLSSRLSRGREILAARLTRRGIALSAAAIASLLTSNAATAAPAATLIASTTSAAMSFATSGTLAAGIVSAKATILSEGVLHAMFISKAKIVASLIVAAALTGTGVIVVTQIALADKGDKPAKVAQPDNLGGKGGKADYVKPDLAGTITEISADGKQITLQTSKGGKGEPAAAGAFQLAADTDITFSGIAAGGDVAAAGYQAQVWLEPNSKDRAARVSFSGQQSTKDNRPIGASGKITAVSIDGKRLTIASRAQGEKGGKGEKAGEPMPVEVALTPATQLTFSGVTTGGAVIEQGHDAQVIFDPNAAGTAAAVRITGPEAGAMKGAGLGEVDLTGKVVAVAADGKSVTLESRPELKQPKIDKGAAAEGKPAKGEGKPAKGDALPEGKPAKGEAVPEAKPAKGDVLPEAKPAKGEGLPEAKPLKGEAIAPEPKQAKVEIPAQKIDVAIGAATKVVYFGVAPGGAAPTEGYRASVWLDGAVAKAIVFDAAAGKEKKGPDISSAIVAVSADGKRITITAQPKAKGEKGEKIDKADKVEKEKPEERQIDISEAKVIFNNVHPGQAKPAEGYQAQIWVDPQAPGSATMVILGPGKGKNDADGPQKK